MTDNDMRPIRSPVFNSRSWTPIESPEEFSYPPHKASFKKIWSPNPISCYGWSCQCDRGLLCSWLLDYITAETVAYKDFEAGTIDQKKVFTLAIPMYGLLLYRFKVLPIIQEEWDGQTNPILEFTIPTGLGEQTRYYNETDWRDGLSLPIVEVYNLVKDMLTKTATGVSVMQQAEAFASGIPQAMYCEGRTHTIGTNMALLAKLKQGSYARKMAIEAHAFCMFHTSKCLICTCNEEMTFSIVADNL